MTQKSSYGQILKSSSIMGGVAVISILLGMVRVKFSAILIGAMGTGIAANFGAIQGFIGTIAGMGIQSSAVRDLAGAYSKGDQQEIGRTILILRRICWLTGLLGMATMVLLSPLLSNLTFGSTQYQLDIAALGLVILLSNITGGQTALLQGTRRIVEMAHMQILSAVVVTIVSISLYYWLGLRGIVPALVAMAIFGVAISWHFARRVPVPTVQMSWLQSLHASGSMVRLGLVLTWNGLLSAAVTFGTNAMITQQISVQAVGICSAAFALSGVFVNFVLGAMATDYYPRLAGAVDDKSAMIRMVNEQIEIGLLLAFPGILAIIALAPWVIKIFYSDEFLEGTVLLRWFILGCYIRVIIWPLSLLILVRASKKIFFLLETSFFFIHFVLIKFGLLLFKLEGVAIAFFVSYIIYTVAVSFLTKKIVDFKISKSCVNLLLASTGILFVFFISFYFLQSQSLTIFGVAIASISMIGCLRGIINRVGHLNAFFKILFKIPGIKFFCTIKL